MNSDMRATMVATFAAAVLMTASHANAQTRASLSGRLIDELTHRPVRAGVIQIAKTNQRVLTDSLGNFMIPNVARGTHKVTASALGYRQITVSASTSSPLVIAISLEPVPLAAVTALATARDVRMPGATVKVFGRAELVAAGDIPVAQFVNWKAHFITRPCQVADTLGGPDVLVGTECIIGARGSYAPVRVMVDGEMLRYSDEMWAHKTWDLGRVEVTYQYSALTFPFERPGAVIRMYTLPYLARTAGRVAHVCDRIATFDSIAHDYLSSLCRR